MTELYLNESYNRSGGGGGGGSTILPHSGSRKRQNWDEVK